MLDMTPRGNGRMAMALAVMLLVGLSAFTTMEPGKYRNLTFVLLGFFAVRIVLGRLRSR